MDQSQQKLSYNFNITSSSACDYSLKAFTNDTIFKDKLIHLATMSISIIYLLIYLFNLITISFTLVRNCSIPKSNKPCFIILFRHILCITSIIGIHGWSLIYSLSNILGVSLSNFNVLIFCQLTSFLNNLAFDFCSLVSCMQSIVQSLIVVYGNRLIKFNNNKTQITIKLFLMSSLLIIVSINSVATTKSSQDITISKTLINGTIIYQKERVCVHTSNIRVNVCFWIYYQTIRIFNSVFLPFTIYLLTNTIILIHLYKSQGVIKRKFVRVLFQKVFINAWHILAGIVVELIPFLFRDEILSYQKACGLIQLLIRSVSVCLYSIYAFDGLINRQTRRSFLRSTRESIAVSSIDYRKTNRIIRKDLFPVISCIDLQLKKTNLN